VFLFQNFLPSRDPRGLLRFRIGGPPPTLPIVLAPHPPERNQLVCGSGTARSRRRRRRRISEPPRVPRPKQGCGLRAGRASPSDHGAAAEAVPAAAVARAKPGKEKSRQRSTPDPTKFRDAQRSWGWVGSESDTIPGGGQVGRRGTCEHLIFTWISLLIHHLFLPACTNEGKTR
jgi:hypothetical protein